MNALTIRPALAADVSAVGALRREVSREASRAYDPARVAEWAAERHSDAKVAVELDGPKPSLMLVAVTPDGVIGGTAYAQISEEAHSADAYVGGLYLRSFARRQGLGSALLERRLRWLSRAGARRALAEAAADNHAAAMLLTGRGFTERGRVPFAQVPGLDWVEFTLDLPGA